MILLGVITIRDYIKIITQAKDYVFFGFDKEFDLGVLLLLALGAVHILRTCFLDPF